MIISSLMCVLGGREGFLMLSYHSVTISISININREEMSKTEKGRNYHSERSSVGPNAWQPR